MNTPIATDSETPVKHRSPYRLRYIAYGLAVGVVLSTLLSAIGVAVVVVGGLDTSTLSSTSDVAALTDDLTNDVVAAAYSPLAIILSLIGLWAGLAGVPYWASKKRGTGSLATDFWWRFNWKRDILIGIGVGFGLRVVISLLTMGASALGVPMDEMSNTDFLSGHSLVITAVLAVAGFVGAPIVEELFFRGLTLQSLTRRWGPVVGVVVSSVLFGFMHFQGANAGSFFIVGMTGLAGAVFAVLTLKSKRMGPAVMSHIMFNFSGILGVLILGQ